MNEKIFLNFQLSNNHPYTMKCTKRKSCHRYTQPFLILLVTTTSAVQIEKNWRLLQQQTTRRKWSEETITSMSALFVPHRCQAAAADSDDDVLALRQACASGALSLERSIPGAYDNICMYLPEREVPITFHDNEGVRTKLLKIEQRVVGPGNTGMALWNSSLLLLRLLQELPPSFWTQHSSVLELGCGTAAASLASAALGASRVWATDGNINVVELAKANIQANPIKHAQVDAQQLSWGALDAVDFSEIASLVIGSDLTYNPAAWPLLADTMATVLQPAGLVLYLSTGHPGFDVQGETDGFLSVARSRGLVPVLPSDPEYPFEISPEKWLLQSYRSDEERTLMGYGLRVSILRKAIQPRKWKA